MKTWDEMTDAERDEANEAAYASACSYVRDGLREGLDDGAARQWAYDTLQRYYDDCARLIRRAQRTRATKMDKRSAESSRSMMFDLGLAQGFIWDVEV